MYEAAVKDALYTLINANLDTLVSGITEQGAAKAIQLTKELVVAVKHGYYVSLALTGMRSGEDSGVQAVNADEAVMWAEYDVQVEIFGYAKDLTGGLHAFEVSGKNFDLVVSRFLKLIREQSSFTSSVHGTHMFKLRQLPGASRNRRIDVAITDLPSQRTGGPPAWYAVLSFTLEECLSLDGAS